MPDPGALKTVGLHAIQQSMDRDVFVVGYPKSGNTWYQYLVAGAVFGCQPALAPDALVQELVPDVHAKSSFRRFGDRAFFKSHHLPQPEYRSVIYLLRDGRDVMVSYFHYLNAINATSISFADIVGDESLFPSRWHEHVDAWMANPFGARIMVVRYESLKRDCLNELRRLCRFLEIEREESWLRLVAEETEFRRMQQKEATQGWANTAWPKDRAFVRRGDIGSYRDEMPPEALHRFLKDAGSTLAKLGYSSIAGTTHTPGQTEGWVYDPGNPQLRRPTRPDKVVETTLEIRPKVTAEGLGLSPEAEVIGEDPFGRYWFKIPGPERRVYDPRKRQLYRAFRRAAGNWTLEKMPLPGSSQTSAHGGRN